MQVREVIECDECGDIRPYGDGSECQECFLRKALEEEKSKTLTLRGQLENLRELRRRDRIEHEPDPA